jgi:hypothetical protein
MSKLSYEEFVKKYIYESTGGTILESLKNEMGVHDMEIFEMIVESVAQSYYQDYLDGKLDKIDDNEDNNN